MKTAEQPFRFVTATYLTRICNQKATCLVELRDGLENCSDASIFYHTFQSLSQHHFLTEGFSNDFAQWTLAACNRPELAERLAAVDIRQYLSLAELRNDLRLIVADYCQAHPQPTKQLAFQPFFFCESIEVTVPLKVEARTLREFREAVEHLGNDSFHYHFIASRLRLQLRTNDFSHWLSNELKLEAPADDIDRIDIYTNTLEDIRAKLLALLDQEVKP